MSGFADAEDWAVPCTGEPGSFAALVLGDFDGVDGGRLAPKITSAPFPPKTGPLVTPITGIALVLLADQRFSRAACSSSNSYHFGNPGTIRDFNHNVP